MPAGLMLLFLAGIHGSAGQPLSLDYLPVLWNGIRGNYPGHFDQPHPDQFLSTVELINKHGYNGECHEIITEDLYVLQLHRIAGRNGTTTNTDKPPILLMHGLLASSSSWVINGPEKALGYVLADAGYDVWLGNARGSEYSRRHVTMTTRHKQYWDFSWHEIGTRDLPAMIDYVLKRTGRDKLFYIGHSQGTTAFFAMASERKGYQDKVNAMFALAPVAYCSRMYSPFVRILAKFDDQIHFMTKLIGAYEFSPTTEFMQRVKSIVCDEKSITQPLCSNTLFLIAGFSPHQLNRTLLPTILAHVPAGASVKQFVHYTQLINSGKFRQYDHGIIGNLKTYKKFAPPAYDLQSIKVPVFLHYSVNDWLAHVRDVHQLYNQLGNPVAKFRVPDDEFNHLDFMWGIDARRFIYDKIVSLMSSFREL